MGIVKYNKSKKLDLIELYHKVRSISEMERVYGVPHSTMSSILKEFGVRTYKSTYRALNKPVTARYRDNWNNLSDAQKGYICGILASDGSLDNKRPRIELALTIEDRHVVDSIASLVTTPPVTVSVRKSSIKVFPNGKEYEPKNSVRIKYTAKDAYKWLVEFGITPAKSLTLNPKLDDKSEEFLWYFLRGVIDGDGCVLSGSSLDYTIIKIVSASPKFLQSLQHLFGGTITQRPGSNPPLYDLSFHGRLAQLIAEKLPTDYFCMARKSERIQEILNIVPKYNNSRVGVKGVCLITES